MIQLVIRYDPNTDGCSVEGIPMGTDHAGRQVPIKGICYGALEMAKKTISDFSPDAKDKPAIVLAGAGTIPTNRVNGRNA